MESSAAIPMRAEIVERGLSALTDDDVDHLADVMAQIWRRSRRIGALGAVLPVGGCGVLLTASPELLGAAVAFGGAGLLAGAFISAVANVLLGRRLALEVESLGYDAKVRREVERAYQKAIRSFLPRLTHDSRVDRCRGVLLDVRGRYSADHLR